MAIRDDKFWAEFLGAEPSEWNTSGVSVRAHVGLAGYSGLWCFRRNDRVVVSAPQGWIPFLSSQLKASASSQLLDEAFLTNLLGNDFERMIGPAFQGCLDPLRFRAFPAEEVRSLTSGDKPKLEQFRVQCGESNLETSGLDKAANHLVGYFEDSMLVAVAGYRSWSPVAGDPCILTHPAFHGRGYGTAVASAVVQRALTAGKLLLYQTLEANVGAVGIARKLGYEQYARHIAVRLRNDAPSRSTHEQGL